MRVKIIEYTEGDPAQPVKVLQILETQHKALTGILTEYPFHRIYNVVFLHDHAVISLSPITMEQP